MTKRNKNNYYLEKEVYSCSLFRCMCFSQIGWNWESRFWTHIYFYLEIMLTTCIISPSIMYYTTSPRKVNTFLSYFFICCPITKCALTAQCNFDRAIISHKRLLSTIHKLLSVFLRICTLWILQQQSYSPVSEPTYYLLWFFRQKNKAHKIYGWDLRLLAWNFCTRFLRQIRYTFPKF